jgi:hypothetical protein
MGAFWMGTDWEWASDRIGPSDKQSYHNFQKLPPKKTLPNFKKENDGQLVNDFMFLPLNFELLGLQRKLSFGFSLEEPKLRPGSKGRVW